MVKDVVTVANDTSMAPGFRRRSLIATTLLLEEQASIAPEALRTSYVIATTLCAQAAAECVLNEWAQRRDPETYRRIAPENWPFVRLVEEVLPKIAGDLPPNIIVMTNVKNALCNPEPDQARSERVDGWLTGDGAQLALAVVLSLDSQFFPNGAPAAAKSRM